MSSTFVKAAEVWVPSSDGALLEYGAGSFGAARRFAAMSQSMCFGRGEGLPGRAWDEGCPILLPTFKGSYFRRTEAANAAGLSCAIALPLFPYGTFSGVLVLFCNHDSGHPGALELWHAGAGEGAELTFLAGAYGAADAHSVSFEALSREARFVRGTGLPGTAWQRGAAVFIDDLAATSNGFVRAGQAAAAGLAHGLAIPSSLRPDESYVVTFLTGAKVPLARRIECWMPNEGQTQLSRISAFGDIPGHADDHSIALPLTGSEDRSKASIATAWLTGAATIDNQPGSAAAIPGAASTEATTASALVAIPVIWESDVVEVVALYL